MNIKLKAMIHDALAEIPVGLRTERVFGVCRIWHRQHGTLPTLAKLRDLVGKGSYTDLGRDLKAFAATVETQVERTIKQPGMPEDLGIQINEIVNQLWVVTSEKAEERFAADRLTMQTQYDQVIAQNESLAAERLQALQERSQAFEDLAAEKRKVSELESAVLEQKRKVSELETALLETTRAKDAEIGKLQTDLVAANRLVEAKDVAVAQLREQVAGLQDQVRSERELAEGFRTKAANAETMLASTKVRAEQGERDNARLRELVADRDRRIAEIEAALVSNAEHFREKLSVVDLTNATLRGQIDELRRQISDLDAARTAQAIRIAEMEVGIAATPKGA